MADQLPYCIHCGARQLNADSKFCHQCGQPIVPAATPGRRTRPPWIGPVLVSAAIIVVAAVVLASVLSRGPTASKPTAATPTKAQPQAARVTPAIVAAALGITTPPPPTPTETPQPTPMLANITPEPVKLTQFAWSPDGKLLAVGSATGVYLYDIATWQEARFIPVKVSIPSRSEDRVWALAFSFDSTMLAAGAWPIVQVWRVADGALAYTIDGTTPLAASPTEGLWATFGPFSGASRGIHLWRTSDGQLVRTIPNDLLHPNTMAFSPDGRLLAVGSAPGDPPGMWQVADGRQVAQLNWPNAERYFWQSVAYHPNSTTVASAGSDIGMGVQNVFVLWDAQRGAVTREIIGQGAPSQKANIRKVCYAPDGSLLAAYFGDYSGQENRVQLWSADGSAGRSWPLPGPASDISFTPDGKLLAVAEGERVAFYDPTTGSLVRQMTPPWHQGILPTPTPTPLHAGLQVPPDWLTCYNVIRFPGFRLMHPPTWRESGKSDFSVSLRKKAASTQDTPMLIEVRVSPGLSCDPASRVSVDNIKKHRSEMINGGVFVTSGEWPYIIPAVFAEFEVQIEPLWAEGLGIPGQSKIREIDLEWSYAGNRCSSATLTYSHELGEQDRLDVSLMLASIQFEDETHRFPTATPTFTPTPNPLPRPVLPLQLTLKAEKVRTGDYEGSHITIEVKDAHGQPVNGAEVTFILQRWGGTRLGVTREGRVETAGSGDILNEKATVEIYWNQELIARQEFVISWQ